MGITLLQRWKEEKNQDKKKDGGQPNKKKGTRKSFNAAIPQNPLQNLGEPSQISPPPLAKLRQFHPRSAAACRPRHPRLNPVPSKQLPELLRVARENDSEWKS